MIRIGREIQCHPYAGLFGELLTKWKLHHQTLKMSRLMFLSTQENFFSDNVDQYWQYRLTYWLNV